MIALVGTALFPVITTFLTIEFSTTSKDNSIFPLVTFASGLTSANFPVANKFL